MVAGIRQLGVNITVNVSLEVLALPLVSVSPLSLSVQTGEDLVLRCDVQGLNPRNSTAYLEWVKNKDILSSGQGSYRNNIISIETIEILIKLFCFVKIIMFKNVFSRNNELVHAHILYNLSAGFPSILYTGNELTLTISKAQKRHTGHYVCHLSYSILGVNGSRKAASNVYVYSPGKTTLQPIDYLYMLVYFKDGLKLHFLNTSLIFKMIYVARRPWMRMDSAGRPG